MKAILTSTSKTIEFNGQPVRIWEGKTSTGIKVHAYITSIACDHEADIAAFEAELQEHKPPSNEVAAIPIRMALE